MTDLLDQSAVAQLAALKAREVSAAELMQLTLDRIADRNGAVNAIVALQDRDALIKAAEATPDGPLQGLPIAVKDLSDTKGIPTTYGSPIFKDHIPAADAPMVAKLRQAGAVIIGKTNTPEFGLGSHSYNPVYGRTRNPYDLSASAGGSSGGAAVALATGMTALADGSDMMGSLRNPAGWNNVYGFRPSYGLVPNAGPGELFLHQLATNGPMARNMTDLELLLSVQAAPDATHPHSCGPFDGANHTRPITPPMKIGWLGDWGGAYPVQDGILQLCAATLEALTQRGHEIVPLDPPFSAAALWDSWITLRHWAVAEKFRALFEDPAKRDLLKPEALWEIEQGLSLSAADVHRASVIRSDWFRATAALPVDAFCLPSAQVFAFPGEWDWPKEINGQSMDTYHRWMEVVVPASLTGLPALSVPAGFGPDGTPMGLQIIGHRGRDADILALGRDIEQVTEFKQREVKMVGGNTGPAPQKRST